MKNAPREGRACMKNRAILSFRWNVLNELHFDSVIRDPRRH